MSVQYIHCYCNTYIALRGEPEIYVRFDFSSIRTLHCRVPTIMCGRCLTVELDELVKATFNDAIMVQLGLLNGSYSVAVHGRKQVKNYSCCFYRYRFTRASFHCVAHEYTNSSGSSLTKVHPFLVCSRVQGIFLLCTRLILGLPPSGIHLLRSVHSSAAQDQS